MKLLRLIFVFYLSCTAVNNAQSPLGKGRTNAGTDNTRLQERLQLTTNIVKQRYCSEDTEHKLVLTLRLDFTNSGSVPIIIDKNSTTTRRTIVSRDLVAAAAKQYEYEEVPYIDLARAGVHLDAAPNESFFVIIKPGESYSLEKTVKIWLYDTAEPSADDLSPGQHYLQLEVYTWYFIAPPEKYPDRWWQSKGYLWADGIGSLPMPFTVAKQHEVENCSS